jgi:hypothetical protein
MESYGDSYGDSDTCRQPLSQLEGEQHTWKATVVEAKGNLCLRWHVCICQGSYVQTKTNPYTIYVYILNLF